MNVHTPTPYRLSHNMHGLGNRLVHGVEDNAGRSIANCGTGTDGKANAAFIVRACNSHDDLVSALEIAMNDKPTGAAYLVWEQTTRELLAKAKA